jgi:hypothetical protein
VNNLQAASDLESNTYFFGARELARLAVYRAAVVARFYTDECAPVSTRYRAETTRLINSLRREQQTAA